MLLRVKTFFDNKCSKILYDSRAAAHKAANIWQTFISKETYLPYNLKLYLLNIIDKGLKHTQIYYFLLCNKKRKQIIKKRKFFLNNLSKQIRNYNNHYLNNRLKKHKLFFDGKDYKLKYPLDIDQRLAIIKDEKHNLVIAAAGSGKTSVITSRIVYLLRKDDKVTKTKILALAFTRAAANEMQERLYRNYSVNINISTFHKLGRSIIVEATGKQPSLLFDNKDADKKHKNFLKNVFLNCLKNRRIQKFLIEYLQNFVGIDVNFYISEYDTNIEEYGLRENKIYDWLAQDSKHLKSIIRQYLISQKDKSIHKDIHYIKINYSDFVEKVYQLRESSFEILKLISSFITLAKSNFFKPGDIHKRLNSNKYDDEQILFGRLANKVYIMYEQTMKKQGKIDFNDMINQAIDIIKSNPKKYKDRYEHILIDEFQDISKQRMELIKCFVNTNSNTKLFCVGDDWQSIYRFTGSEVEYFVDFNKYFPNPAISFLKTNYRCSKTTIDASNKLISNNKHQIKKQVIANSTQQKKILLYEIDNYFHYFAPIQIQHAKNLIYKLIKKGVLEQEILVLSRFKRNIKDLKQKCIDNRIKIFSKEKNNCGVRFYTVHSSKGLEAKHVIILDVISGTYGFPCEIENPKILEPARQNVASNLFDEERRLFYVALTRSKKNIYIYTCKDKHSIFLDEIKNYTDTKETIQYIPFK